jgi:hypothetical protein
MMIKSNTINWDDILKIVSDLQDHKETLTESILSLFEEADYKRGDKIYVNSVFFEDAKIPDLVKHRIIPNHYIPYDKYIVVPGDKPQPSFEMKFNYGLVLNNKSWIAGSVA